jgi:hypothetical protein
MLTADFSPEGPEYAEESLNSYTATQWLPKLVCLKPQLNTCCASYLCFSSFPIELSYIPPSHPRQNLKLTSTFDLLHGT